MPRPRAYAKLRVDPKKFRELLERALAPIYEYNKALGGAYYLKPVHIAYKQGSAGEVREYRYFGRYWYVVEYLGKSDGRSYLKWTYLGREKPPGAPDPPASSLEGVKFYTVRGEESCVYVELSCLEKFVEVFKEAVLGPGEALLEGRGDERRRS